MDNNDARGSGQEKEQEEFNERMNALFGISSSHRNSTFTPEVKEKWEPTPLCPSHSGNTKHHSATGGMQDWNANASLVLRGSNRKLEKSLEPKSMKSFKKFLNDWKNIRKCRPRRRRQNDAGNLPPQIQQVQGEKGCRIGGSTTHLLPEPRANGMASGENPWGIERIDTPPTDI